MSWPSLSWSPMCSTSTADIAPRNSARPYFAEVESNPPDATTGMPKGEAIRSTCGSMPAASTATSSRRGLLALEPEIGDGVAERREHVVGVIPRRRLPYFESIVPDRRPRHPLGPPRPVEHLAQPGIRPPVLARTLGVPVRANQPVEDLADRQRQVVGVLRQHLLDLPEEQPVLGARLPRRQAANATCQIGARVPDWSARARLA